MATVLERPAKPQFSNLTLADLAQVFGPMPASRIHMDPLLERRPPMMFWAAHRHDKRLCELVDGVLVEKVLGYEESVLAVVIITLLVHLVSAEKVGDHRWR